MKLLCWLNSVISSQSDSPTWWFKYTNVSESSSVSTIRVLIWRNTQPSKIVGLYIFGKVVVLSYIRNPDGSGVGLWYIDVLKPVIAVTDITFCTSDQTSLWIYEPNIWSSYVKKCSGLPPLYICFFSLFPLSISTPTFWNSFYVSTVSRVLTCSKWLLLVTISKLISFQFHVCNTYSKSVFFNKFLCLSLFLVLQNYSTLIICLFLSVCQSVFAGKPKYNLLYKCTLEEINKWSYKMIFLLLLVLLCSELFLFVCIFILLNLIHILISQTGFIAVFKVNIVCCQTGMPCVQSEDCHGYLPWNSVVNLLFKYFYMHHLIFLR